MIEFIRAKDVFMLQFAFSLCHGENEKWANPLMISLPGLCFGENHQRLLRHFLRLKHESVREKAAKNVFAQIESILFSNENPYRDSEPHCFRVVFSLLNLFTFLFSFGVTFLRVVSHSPLVFLSLLLSR